MLSLQDCLDMSELSEDEIEAIAEHENVPEIVAAEMGNTLLKTNAGACLLKLYMLDNLERAKEHGHIDKAKRLRRMIGHFDYTHPGAELH